MLLVAVVDDDREELQELAGYVKDYFDRADESYVIHQFNDGVEFIRSREMYNIVFMDIRMGELDGLDAARFMRIVNKEAQLIFVTHMAQLAIKGYEVDALDFIVKPVDQIAIDRVLDKAMKKIDKSMEASFALKTSDGIVSVSSSDIYYVEVYDHDLIYHTTQGNYKVRGTLSDVKEKLDDRHFIQCSRSYLVNMRHIKSVHKDYVEVNGEQIQLSQSHRREIEQRFINYLGESI